MLVIDLVVLAGLAGLLLYYFEPHYLFSQTTTTGGDTGAHIYAPWYLKTHLLPHGLLSGWSPGWFAGFPMLQFYFPLVATFQALAAFVIPYTIAFKLGTVLGTLFLPLAFYVFFRLLRFRFPAPVIAAICAMGFLFLQSFTIYGGNIASSLAGEYGYSLSLGLVLVELGLLYRVVTDERPPLLAGLLVLAAASLSHVVPVITVAMSIPIFLIPWIRTIPLSAALRRLGILLGVAFALTAFWSVPFVARIGYTPNMNWIPLQGLSILFPREVKIYVAASALAVLVGLLRRDGRLLLLTFMPVSSFVLYFALPQGHLWNGRFVPFWFLGLFLCAAYLVGTLVPSIARAVTSRRSGALAIAAVMLLLGLSVWKLADKGNSYVDDWIALNYNGYEGRTTYPTFRALLDKIAALPPGRVMWEESNAWGKFGTPDALMALPYFTGHPSMEGLYYESSITTPFHFLMGAEVSKTPPDPIPGLPYRNFDLATGIQHMELFDVSYYVTITKAAQREAISQGLRVLDRERGMAIFEVPSSGMVTSPRYAPVVLEGGNWVRSNLGWFGNTKDLGAPLLKSGPKDLQRIHSIAQPIPLQEIPPARVQDVKVSDNKISFTTSAIGQPLWIKTSYFPNWRAEGAVGPFMASPSLMMVFPTQHKVTLVYSRTWAEWAGLVLTLAAVLSLSIPWTRRKLLSAAA